MSNKIKKSDGSHRFMDTVNSLEKKIRNKAYEIFENREDHEGDAMSDWLRAQSEVLTTIALKMQEEEDRYVVQGKLPDEFEPSDVSFDVSDGRFKVVGTHITETASKGKGNRSSSRSEVSFLREMSLPADVDTDRLDARFDKGMMVVTIPKARS